MKTKLFLAYLFCVLLTISACAQDSVKKDGMTKPDQAAKNPQRSNTEPLTVGEIAPDFTLMDENGKPVTLSKVKQPVVLVFYRGYW